MDGLGEAAANAASSRSSASLDQALDVGPLGIGLGRSLRCAPRCRDLNVCQGVEHQRVLAEQFWTKHIFFGIKGDVRMLTGVCAPLCARSVRT